MEPLERYDYSGDDVVDGGGGGNVVQERYRIGEVADFGDGLRATVTEDAEARAMIEQMAQSSDGVPTGLFDTAAHSAAWTIAWRYFCDSCGQSRDGKWFTGDFCPTTYWGRTAENGVLQRVSFVFNIEPAAEGISRMTVCGDVNDLRVALARADYRHYNKPATIKPLLYAE